MMVGGGRFRKETLWRFYLARFARIYPVYIVTILVMLPVLANGTAADQQFREL
jgi:peptidoglycan/LPS O-acetylase OafA/YrhL